MEIRRKVYNIRYYSGGVGGSSISLTGIFMKVTGKIIWLMGKVE